MEFGNMGQGGWIEQVCVDGQWKGEEGICRKLQRPEQEIDGGERIGGRVVETGREERKTGVLMENRREPKT